MTNFQTIVLIVFLVFIVLGVLLFTGILPGFRAPEGGFGGEVELWGTIPEESMRSLVDVFNQENQDLFTVVYVEKNESVFEQELIEALAAGTGPDLFMLPQDLILKHEDKIYPISFDLFSERDFRDAFIEEGELYKNDNGFLALPFVIDPLVMYYNRSILTSAGVAQAPSFWDEFLILSPAVSEVDEARNILSSFVALGEFTNVIHAKDILSALVLQTGNNITGRTESGVEIIFGGTGGQNLNRAVSALRFYTEFANPARPTYSWNRSRSDSNDAFSAEELAVYFGFASELQGIVAQNPHLNLDMAPLPQIRDGDTRKTYGRLNGLAIAKNSDNRTTAFQVAYMMTGSKFLDGLEKVLRLPPVRRDMLAEKPTDVYGSILYDSALMSSGWLDPSPQASYNIFKDMVEGVSSGRFKLSEAVNNATTELWQLVK